MTIFEKYLEAMNTRSDINDHVETLKNYADRCSHVTEMGTRQCVSVWGLLASKAEKVVSYDISKQPQVDECIEICKKENRDFTFIEADVLKVDISETDLIFYDTFHTASQLSAELAKHSHKAKRYQIFHDVLTYWEVGELPESDLVASNKTNCGRGLKYAIEPFLKNNPSWKEVYRSEYCNGLLILEKQ